MRESDAHFLTPSEERPPSVVFPQAPKLKRLNPNVLFIIQSELNSVLQPTRIKVGLNARADGRRVVLVEPRVQLLQLSRREHPDRMFDLL